MYQMSKKFHTRILTYAALVIFCLMVIGMFAYSYVSKYMSDKLEIKSRYTFSIRIDDDWNVIRDDAVSDYSAEDSVGDSGGGEDLSDGE